jgi:dipeptidase E
MAKLYFLGGENVSKRDAKTVNEKAFQDAGGNPTVLVFPWARPSFDASYQKRKRVSEYFRSLGARSVDFAEYSESIEEIKAKAKSSGLIYLTGGQVRALLTRLRNKQVEAWLREYEGVLVGRSAGALVLGRKCLVTNRYSRRSKLIEGLGLVDFSLKAHYNSSQEYLLKKLSKTGKFYAIPPRHALISRRDVISFIGDVFLFENGAKELLR